MLALSQAADGDLTIERKRLKPGSLLTGTLTALWPAAEKAGVKVDVLGDTATWPVIEGDAIRLQQSLTNIVLETEIVERLLLKLINEGAKILDEGIALRASDIDTIYLTGYGFLAWRGGPMWFADTVGLKKVYDRICQLEKQFGSDLWAPAALLKQLAESGKTFAQWDETR